MEVRTAGRNRSCRSCMRGYVRRSRRRRRHATRLLLSNRECWSATLQETQR